MPRLVAALLAIFALTSGAAAQSLADRALELVSPVVSARHAAIDFFVSRGAKDALPALILASRFAGDDRELRTAIESLAGEQRAGWFGWMLWQEAHPEIQPFAGFDDFQARLYLKIDAEFALFLHPGVAHSIRLEEIAWGGVVKDGIPALTKPKLIAAPDAAYLTPDDLVFGVSINGDERAFPLRIMDWHEMLNDVIGGVPVSLAYCTLCGSGILYETAVGGRDKPFIFGSSGFLYRSNKLMYDGETNSLWSQFEGRPVVGPLTGSGIVLKTRPVVIARWADWRAAHPATRVLALDTGYDRDYRPGAAYGDYFASPDLMFPALATEGAVKPKDYVFVLRTDGPGAAWPLSRFKGGAAIVDSVGALNVVLIGDEASGTVRAFRGDGRAFEAGASLEAPVSNGKAWRVTEDALLGPEGESFPRLPGHVAYGFAWVGAFGADGELKN